MQVVINDIFYSIYQYLGFGIVFGVLCIIAFPELEKKGFKKVFFQQYYMLKKDKYTRYRFIFFIILFMVLSRTLICRNIWKCPWENIIGQYGIFTSDGKLNIEGLLNIVLFVPLTYFGMLGFIYQDILNKKIMLNAVKFSFVFSCIIEITQLFLRLGTFQLSDIFQNTLGGLIGSLIYIIHKK